MAVKVMVATAISKDSLKREEKPRLEPKKPKHRRSSVFDADGNEVYITLLCLKCRKMRPLSLFGLRKMADGAIRNQPWCRSCRSGKEEKPTRKRRASSSAPAVEAISSSEPSANEKSGMPTRSVAAEVADALSAGWRR
jgi:hypothetical protein